MRLHIKKCCKIKGIIYFMIYSSLAVSCAQVKDVVYFQHMERGQPTLNYSEYDAQIKTKDILSITVVSSEPAASHRYNLISPQTERIMGASITMGTVSNYNNQSILQNYLVDSNGEINFPTLGKIKVKGMSTNELTDLIERQLAPFFSEEMPVITIRIINYTVNIIGEVHRPGKFESANGRMTILEGLALAGDMTIYGRRDNVKVIREDVKGERVVYTINLNDRNVFNSPAFFLEQNDVVYVAPNQSRANASKYGAAESYRISTLSVLISLATMAVTIFGVAR